MISGVPDRQTEAQPVPCTALLSQKHRVGADRPQSDAQPQIRSLADLSGRSHQLIPFYASTRQLS